MSPTLATALAWATFHTLMIFWPFGQQAIQLAVSLAPALAAAVPAVAAAGAAGGAALAAGIALPVAVPVATGLPAPAPTGAAPVPAPVAFATAAVTGPATSSATTTPLPTTSTIGTGPAGGGPGVGFGPTASTGLGADLMNALYVAATSGSSARTGASGRARRESEEPAVDDFAALGVAPARAAETGRRRRRRSAPVADRAHRYEFMDPDPGLEAAASGQGAGWLGFAGATTKAGATPAAGLKTLGADGLSDGPTMPMLPSGWAGGSPEKTDSQRFPT
jgi:hypothetical protein